jgi:hypothetical protein
MTRYFILFLLIILQTFKGFAQQTKQITNQKLVWYGYYLTLQLNEKYFLTSEIQERHFVAPFAQHQFVLRSHLHRNLGNGWDVALGMCLFLQSPNENPSKNDLIIPELRPHFAFAQQQKLKFATLNQRYQVEARFFHHTENNELTESYDFGNFRFRYQIGLEIPIWKTQITKRELLSVKFSNEIMVNVGENIVYNFFDQNRIYAALNYKITPNLSLEMGYLNWFQQQKSGNKFYQRDILRFTVFHKIKLYK